MPDPGSDGEALSTTELGAWRGPLRLHRALIRELDAELEQLARLWERLLPGPAAP